MRFAILVSGTGTNLQALIDARARGELGDAELTVVVSNRPAVSALDRADRAGITRVVVDHTAFDSREEFERALLAVLAEHCVDGIVLAGFMRILTEDFVGRFPNRILNTHPALCPAFPGIHAPRQAVECGVKVSGCTVHFVDAGVDTGPIIFQSAVPVEPGDDAASLHRRIQRQEHRLLPLATRLLADRALTVEGRRVTISEEPG